MAVKVKWTVKRSEPAQGTKNDTTPTVRYVGIKWGNTYQPFTLETDDTTRAGTVKETVKNDGKEIQRRTIRRRCREAVYQLG